jgi:hypothetical protein
MSRKQKVRKTPGPRNPFVAAALFKKAGSHRTSEKALRRQANVGSAALRSSIRFLPGGFEFDSQRIHHSENIAESHWFPTVFSYRIFHTPPSDSH